MAEILPKGVAMVISHFFPTVGGAEKQALLLSQELTKKGIAVFVITRKSSAVSWFNSYSGVRVYRTPTLGNIRWVNGFLFIFGALFILGRLKGKIDLLHCHQTYSPMTIGGLAFSLFGKPFVVKITASNQFGEALELQRLRFLSLRKRFLNNASKLLVVNREVIAEFSRFSVPKEKFIHVPNGVAIAEKNLQTRFRIRQKMGVNDESFVFIYTGRLSAEKGLMVLFHAFADLLQEFSNARLWVLGAGGHVRNIEGELKVFVDSKNLKDKIQMIGKVEEVSDHLQAADCFVLLSVSEGMSNSVLEAMALGLPAIVTEIPAMDGVITDGENGLKVPVNDPHATLNAMRRMVMMNSVERKMMGEKSLNLARGEFSIEQVVSKVCGIYREVLKATEEVDG